MLVASPRACMARVGVAGSKLARAERERRGGRGRRRRGRRRGGGRGIGVHGGGGVSGAGQGGGAGKGEKKKREEGDGRTREAPFTGTHRASLLRVSGGKLSPSRVYLRAASCSCVCVCPLFLCRVSRRVPAWVFACLSASVRVAFKMDAASITADCHAMFRLLGIPPSPLVAQAKADAAHFGAEAAKGLAFPASAAGCVSRASGEEAREGAGGDGGLKL